MTIAFPETVARRVPLPRIDDLYSSEAEDRFHRRQPFVTRIPADWGVTNWSIEYLSERIGHLPMPLVRTADGEKLASNLAHVLELTRDPTWRKSYMPARGGGPLISPQVSGRPLDPALECLRADYKLPAYLPADKVSTELLFRASNVDESTYFDTPAHWEYDALSFLSMQVRGRKHVWLFAPDQAPHLGIKSELPEFPFASVGAPAVNDPQSHPEIKEAWCYEVVLEPGHLIYWPAFWVHWFVHYHDYQISFRIKCPQDHHPLDPISAGWAFHERTGTCTRWLRSSAEPIRRAARGDPRATPGDRGIVLRGREPARVDRRQREAIQSGGHASRRRRDAQIVSGHRPARTRTLKFDPTRQKK